ncbi:pPIWI_RE module domain-containing protein [Kitasatospora sp. NPDC004289]
MIRTTAYEPAPATGPWREPHTTIAFPEPLRAGLQQLYRQRLRRGEQPTGLPIRQLNGLLRVVAPGVVATGRGVGSGTADAWLYAREAVPEEVVRPVLNAWVLGSVAGRDDEQQLRAVELLEGIGGLSWQEEDIELTASALSPGGTALPDQRLYHLLPEWIAARLAARPFRSQGVDVRFRIVSREQGTELVSWPPRKYVVGKRAWYYSGTVAITVHTVPFAERFRVHVSTGIRRWVSTDSVWLPQGQGATVLVDAPIPWQPETVERVRLVDSSVRYDRHQGRVGWRRHSELADLLPDLDLRRSYPKAEELIGEPVPWLLGRDGVAAGVVYGNTMASGGKGYLHKVRTGLMPLERSLLDDWVAEGLGWELRRVPDLVRAAKVTKPVLLTKEAKKDGAARAAGRRQRLRGVLDGEPLRLDLLWQSEQAKEELTAALEELSGIPAVRPGAAEEWECETDGVRLRIRLIGIGVLGQPLPAPSGDGGRGAAWAEAMRCRARATAELLGAPAGRALALVELSGPEAFGQPGTDPKDAIRLGCAQAGRLSQFLVPPEEGAADLGIRIRKALLDGLRQLGAVITPEHQVPGLPDRLQYLALRVIRCQGDRRGRAREQRLVALRIRPDEEVHPVRGWDEGTNSWVPYSELLLRLGRDTSAGAVVTAERIRTVLYQTRDRPTVLLAEVGNLRRSWPGLAHGTLVRDLVALDQGRHQRAAVYGPDLRVVLVRDDCGREEVPEWYAPAGTGMVPGLTTGLWTAPGTDPDNRVFGSTADVPATAAARRDLLKLVPDPAWPTAPSKRAWNPQFLELTVQACLSTAALASVGRTDVPADRPVEYATLAHQLRFHDDYDPLGLPLPLHLAVKAEEYVLALTRPDAAGGAEVGGDLG